LYSRLAARVDSARSVRSKPNSSINGELHIN
jgi:hypothetical protein